MHREGLLRAAVCAAVAVAGLTASAKADTAAQPTDLALGRPLYLQDTTARTPLMGVLDRVGVAKALDDAKITVGGLVEGSWTYSASSPPGNFITGRVFDVEHESILLNQAEIHVERLVDDALAKKQFDIGGRMEWRWGTDSRFIHSVGAFDYYGFGDGPKNQWDPTQAYLDFAVPIGNGLKVRVGKFVTPIGTEVIDPSGNQFYSHSYLFGYAIPFTHTGVLGTYQFSDDLSVTAGVTRGWDTSLEDNNDTVDFLGSVTIKLGANADPFSYIGGKNSALTINLISGPDQPGDNDNYRTLIDVIATTLVGDNLKLGFNGDYAYERNSVSSPGGDDAKWWGVAAYAQLGLDRPLDKTPLVALNMRGEYFNDDDGARLAGAVGGAGVFEATVGLAITPLPDDKYGKNLVIRPEVRYDYATKGFFDGGSDRYQVTAAIDAYYKF